MAAWMAPSLRRRGSGVSVSIRAVCSGTQPPSAFASSASGQAASAPVPPRKRCKKPVLPVEVVDMVVLRLRYQGQGAEGLVRSDRRAVRRLRQEVEQVGPVPLLRAREVVVQQVARLGFDADREADDQAEYRDGPVGSRRL